jgi:hypothetical protein
MTGEMNFFFAGHKAVPLLCVTTAVSLGRQTNHLLFFYARSSVALKHPEKACTIVIVTYKDIRQPSLWCTVDSSLLTALPGDKFLPCTRKPMREAKSLRRIRFPSYQYSTHKSSDLLDSWYMCLVSHSFASPGKLSLSPHLSSPNLIMSVSFNSNSAYLSTWGFSLGDIAVINGAGRAIITWMTAAHR